MTESRSNPDRTPAKAGVQYQAARNWTPAFAGVRIRLESQHD